MLALTAELPAKTEIKMWSAWHGYYYVKIAADSVDDATFIGSMVLIVVFILLFRQLRRAGMTGTDPASLPSWFSFGGDGLRTLDLLHPRDEKR